MFELSPSLAVALAINKLIARMELRRCHNVCYEKEHLHDQRKVLSVLTHQLSARLEHHLLPNVILHDVGGDFLRRLAVLSAHSTLI